MSESDVSKTESPDGWWVASALLYFLPMLMPISQDGCVMPLGIHLFYLVLYWVGFAGANVMLVVLPHLLFVAALVVYLFDRRLALIPAGLACLLSWCSLCGAVSFGVGFLSPPLLAVACLRSIASSFPSGPTRRECPICRSTHQPPA